MTAAGSNGGGATAHVATVWAMYEAFGRGDVPAILDRLADDVEWEAGLPETYGIPYLKPGRGKANVGAFFESLRGIDFKRFEPKVVAGDGDTVLALIELEAVVLDTGRSVSDTEVHVWWFDGSGAVRAFRHVIDTAQHARAAAGE